MGKTPRPGQGSLKSATGQPPKERPAADEPKPPRDAAVARDIGGCPAVAAGRANWLLFSAARPVFEENVLVRAALV